MASVCNRLRDKSEKNSSACSRTHFRRTQSLISWQSARPVGLVLSHFSDIVPVLSDEVLMVFMEFFQFGLVQADTQARFRGDPDAAVLEPEPAAFNHVVNLPRVMRVAVVGQVRDAGRDMGHRHQTDPKMGIGMHREAEAPNIANPAQLPGGPEAAPV